MICTVRGEHFGQDDERPAQVKEEIGHIGRTDSAGKDLALLPRGTALVSLGILIACIAAFVRYNLIQREIPLDLTFSPGNGYLFPGVVSHVFVHAHIPHLLFNMLLLYFLGFWVERVYGAWRYAVLFLGAGLFAGLAQAFTSPQAYLLGASGALSGVMAAFIRHFPTARLYIWGILPVPAWLLGLFWIAYNLVGVDSEGAETAFMAHLGGFAAGIVLSLVLIPPKRLST